MTHTEKWMEIRARYLDKEISEYAEQNDYFYVIDEEPFLRNPTDKPIIINYFYHEKIRQSDKKK